MSTDTYRGKKFSEVFDDLIEEKYSKETAELAKQKYKKHKVINGKVIYETKLPQKFATQNIVYEATEDMIKYISTDKSKSVDLVEKFRFDDKAEKGFITIPIYA